MLKDFFPLELFVAEEDDLKMIMNDDMMLLIDQFLMVERNFDDYQMKMMEEKN
jgi:hypothetical protein